MCGAYPDFGLFVLMYPDALKTLF